MSLTFGPRLGKAAAAIALLTAVAFGVSACAQSPQPAAPNTPAAQQTSVPRGVVDNAFQFGSGPIVVDLFTDASCPHCKRFDLTTYADLQGRIDANEITFRMHPMNYVSGKHGDATEFSTRAMNLLAAIADSGQLSRVPAVYNGVLEAQPADESQPLPDNAQLLDIAKSNGVHVTSGLRAAVESGRWNDWVQHVNDLSSGKEIGDTGVTLQGVPTVLVNGKQFEIREDGTDLQRLQAAIAAAH